MMQLELGHRGVLQPRWVQSNKRNFLSKKRIKILKPQAENPPPRYFRRCKIDSKSFQIHLDPPVEGVRMTNIEVEVASTRCMPPRWPSSTRKSAFRNRPFLQCVHSYLSKCRDSVLRFLTNFYKSVFSSVN